MNIKLIVVYATILALPFLSQANNENICLGDTYEKVKNLKGFPKKISFINTASIKALDSNETKFEAVTFYNESTIYIFDSSNNRLCKLANSNNNNLGCKIRFEKSQCKD